MDAAAKVLLGKASQADAERLRAKVAQQGISLALVHNAVTCKSGCGIQLEIWAHPADLDGIKELLAAEWQATAASLGYDPALAEAVYDPDAAEATCPACATVFATTLTECPDCGLHFSGPADASSSKGACGPTKGCK